MPRQRAASRLRDLVTLALGVAALGCGDGGEREGPAPQSFHADAPDLPEGETAPHDPTYDGLTLSEWRARIQRIDYDSPDVADAVPGLMEIVRDRDAPWHSRRQAALTLGRIGEPAADAVPMLVELLEEPPQEEGESTPFWALKALALFGPAARDAAPALVEVLQSDERPHLVRLSTLEALGRIGTAHAGTLPAIVETLQLGPAATGTAEAERMQRRVAAAEVLELFRGHAAPAAPALMSACASESVLLRRAAVNTLGVIGQQADTAVPTLVDRLLFDDSAEVRDLAALALARMGSGAEPYLRQLLADSDLEVRWRAADALGDMDRLDTETLESLETALRDEAPRVRLLVAEALWIATEDSDQVVGTVVAELGHPDRQLRMLSVQLLERIGPTPAFGREDLQSLAESDDAELRQAARRVLRNWDER